MSDYDVDDFSILSEREILNNAAVKKFFNGRKLFLLEEEINRHHWKYQQDPVILRVFHGTTHRFEHFTKIRRNHDTQFGDVHYFTSSHFDAYQNYGHAAGPDLASRVAHLSESLYEADDHADPKNWSDPIPEKYVTDAKRQLVGDHPRVIEALVKTQKPFIIDGSRLKSERRFQVFADIEERFSLITEDFFEDHNLCWDTIHEYPRLQEELYEKQSRLTDEIYDDIFTTFHRVCTSLNVRAVDDPTFDDDILEITTAQFRDALSCGMGYDLMDDDGNLVTESITCRIIESLGFDSLILLNADQQFSSMTMDSETAHVHLFESDDSNTLILNHDVMRVEESSLLAA